MSHVVLFCFLIVVFNVSFICVFVLPGIFAQVIVLESWSCLVLFWISFAQFCLMSFWISFCQCRPFSQATGQSPTQLSWS